MENILNILPESLRREIGSIGTNTDITEIRLRANRNVIINISKKEIILESIVRLNDILDILVKVSSNSLYSIQNDINEGFITIKGGHRIGICGEGVISDNKIVNIKNINSLNIRIARQVIGAANKLINYIVDDFEVKNTLIVSPPGCGKTTLLRDLIRQISNGTEKRRGYNIGVVDERGELTSVYNGRNYLDVGLRSDIMSNISKDKGISMLIRSMGLDVITTDEIGTKQDIDAIKKASLCGVSLIFTVHGSTVEDVLKKEDLKPIIDKFDYIVLLSRKQGPGTIEKLHKLNNMNLEEVASL